MTAPIIKPAGPTVDGKNCALIFDNTKRDDAQSPGTSLTVREKLELAELLQG